MNKGDSSKSRSRGISRDMSPEAIARRIDIVSELREFSLFLTNAGKAFKNASAERDSEGPAKKMPHENEQ